MKLNVILEPGDRGWIVAYVPALKGCISQGRTRQEALDNIKDAIEGWLAVEQEKTSKIRRKKGFEIVPVAV